MSDAPQGEGWWEASNSKWYPPEDHPDYVVTRPPPPEWAVEDDEVTDIERLNKITNGIVLGIPKDQVVQNRAESRSWDRLAVQIEKIHASGKSVHIINE